jgi:isocitrate/isopropylmalate dehydrogenase
MNSLDRPLKLLVLEGDGIGPEIVSSTLMVLNAATRRTGTDIALDTMDIGFKALRLHGTTMPEGTVEAARAADGVILGPVSHDEYPPTDQGGKNPSGVLRKSLDLYANIRPAMTRPYVPSPIGRSFDLVIVRENTEGFYADRTMFAGGGEFMPTPDLALAVRKVTVQGSKRIAVSAFELARQRRRHVTAVHKANVLRMSDGLFLEQVRKVASEYPDIAYEEKIVDAMTALLIRHPEKFDVLVTTNMFGDILSDEAGELSGSLRMAASLNSGLAHAVAQAQHGSAPDIAGKDKANPVALMKSTAMLLRWLALRLSCPEAGRAGDLIDQSVETVLANPATRTPDLGGPLGTTAFTQQICQQIAARDSA